MIQFLIELFTVLAACVCAMLAAWFMLIVVAPRVIDAVYNLFSSGFSKTRNLWGAWQGQNR